MRLRVPPVPHRHPQRAQRFLRLLSHEQVLSQSQIRQERIGIQLQLRSSRRRRRLSPLLRPEDLRPLLIDAFQSRVILKGQLEFNQRIRRIAARQVAMRQMLMPARGTLATRRQQVRQLPRPPRVRLRRRKQKFWIRGVFPLDPFEVENRRLIVGQRQAREAQPVTRLMIVGLAPHRPF